jgi:hypothetical protein
MALLARDLPVGTECTLVHCSLYTGCIYRVLTPSGVEKSKSSTSTVFATLPNKFREHVHELENRAEISLGSIPSPNHLSRHDNPTERHREACALLSAEIGMRSWGTW